MKSVFEEKTLISWVVFINKLEVHMMNKIRCRCDQYLTEILKYNDLIIITDYLHAWE